MADMKRLLARLSMPPAPPGTPTEYFSRLPQLETPRLLLRRMNLRDARDMYDYARDPEVARYVLWSAHRSIWDTKAYIRWVIQQYRNGEPCSWCIVDKVDNRVIGTIGFMNYLADNASVEIGYSLARSHWGRGLMPEALQAVLRECFTVLKLHRVEAQHFTANPASGRVMAKCGMAHEGTLRRRIFNKGEYLDVEMWAILREDWRKQHPDA